jgi:hypothetical protein
MSGSFGNLRELNNFQQLRSSLWRWQAGHAFLFFLVAAGLMFYPLLPHFFDKLAVGGDAYEYLWKLWWVKHTLLEGGGSPWVAPHIYYPNGYLMAYGEITAANTFLALPLTWLWGEVPTYNFLIFSSTVLSGFTMFLLAREVSGNFWAGLLAGIIFAFSPFRHLQLLHLNIATTQWFPLIFYFLERFARTRKPAHGLLAGLFFGLNALASWYYAIAGALFTLIWALARLRPLPAYLKDRQSWWAAGLFAAVAGLLILPFAWPYLEVLGNPDTAIPMDNSNYYSASITDYLIPSPFQFLWGRWVFDNLLVQAPDPGEFIIGWGFMASLFGLYGWRFARREDKRPWLAIILVAVILSFGLTLHLLGRQVVIPAPVSVVEKYNRLLNFISEHYALDGEPFTIGQEAGLVVPMPALPLRWFVPVLGQTRTWTRFGVIALFGVAVLAALGAAAWHKREILPKNSAMAERIAWLVVLSLTLFELWWAPFHPITPVLERPVDVWLRQQPGHGAIIEYPLANSFNGEQLVYTRAHGRPIVHGYGLFLGFMLGRRHPELLTFPEPDNLKQLTEWGVQYVLIDGRAGEAQSLLAEVAAVSCLRPATVQESVHVFELVDCGPAVQAGKAGAR